MNQPQGETLLLRAVVTALRRQQGIERQLTELRLDFTNCFPCVPTGDERRRYSQVSQAWCEQLCAARRDLRVALTALEDFEKNGET